MDDAFKNAQPTPDWLKAINKRIQYRRYMYVALATPLGSFPSIGNQSDEKDRPREAVKGWLDDGKLVGLETNVNQLLDDHPKQSPAPAFNSAALPYGGYYALRSGWGHDDLYSFMRSGRDGVGHGRTDNNNLQIAAYGSYLLIHGGDANYSNPTFMPDYEHPIIPYFGESQVGCIFNSNNVSIDGLLQGPPTPRLLSSTKGWDAPRGLRFHTSDEFDLMEGRFDGQYVSETPVSDKVIKDMVADYGIDAMAPCIDYNTRLKQTPPRQIQGSHVRKVFLLRDEKFWIVTEVADGGSNYTQVWHFPPPSEGLNAKSYICPGFDPNQVRIDPDRKRVVTISHYRPNLAILNFTASPVSYAKHFGDMFPFKGWYSFEIVSDRVPAVTVEGTWAGNAPMVSVLVPSRERPDSAATLDDGLTGFTSTSTDTVSGFAATSNSGEVSFQESREPQSLSAFSVAATARSLLARKKSSGVIEGIALDCSAFSVEGSPQNLDSHDFQFVVENGKFRIVAPVTSPTAFRWERDDQGRLYPVYH